MAAPPRFGGDTASSRARLGRRERHKNGVHILPSPRVMPLPEALPLDPELLVEPDRRLVPREHVQLELPHARAPRPLDRRFQERPPHALAARVARDHQADVGDVRARRMRVARHRQPADQGPVRTLGDEHRGVRVAAHRLQIAPLVANGSPLAVRGDEPRLRLAAHLLGQPRQLLRVAGVRPAHDEPAAHATTMPAPPRLGSPAAASVPSARTSTALAPPKNRFLRPKWTSPLRPGSAYTVVPSQWILGASTASSTPIPRPMTLLTTCRIAPRSRSEPAEPTTRRGRPRSSTTDGAIIDVSRSPGRALPFRSASPSMLFR